MDYAMTVTVPSPFAETVERVKVALAEQGFGVLTEVDIQATLKAKVGADIGHYLILGACNPKLAHQALTVEPQIGLFLPCNVVVRDDGDQTLVEALDPHIMVSVPERDDLQPVAQQARDLLVAALASLSGQSG